MQLLEDLELHLCLTLYFCGMVQEGEKPELIDPHGPPPPLPQESSLGVLLL